MSRRLNVSDGVVVGMMLSVNVGNDFDVILKHDTCGGEPLTKMVSVMHERHVMISCHS